MAKYFQEAAADHYRYNFHLVSLAATTIVMYVCMMPLLLWTVLKWTQRPVESDLIQEEVSFNRIDFLRSKYSCFIFFFTGWNLHAKFTDINLSLWLLVGCLHSSVSIFGDSNFVVTVGACDCCRTLDRDRFDHRLESGSAQFIEIANARRWHFGRTFSACRWIFALLLSLSFEQSGHSKRFSGPCTSGRRSSGRHPSGCYQSNDALKCLFFYDLFSLFQCFVLV